MIIRPVTVFERKAVRDFYLALSPNERRKCFCCSLSVETISCYVDQLNFTRDTIPGAFDEQAQIIGLAELVRGAKESEMAFSVRPDQRGQKIGTMLMERLVSRARMCGARLHRQGGSFPFMYASARRKPLLAHTISPYKVA